MTTEQLPFEKSFPAMTLPQQGNSLVPMSQEEIRARARNIHESLAVQNPLDNSSAFARDVNSDMVLRVMDIDLYDRNPRRLPNENYDNIKESIRQVGGIDQKISVTKRPGSNRYMVFSGGNTRLEIVQSLWLETNDPRFEKIEVTYRPWVSEIRTFAAHLMENSEELKGKMSFWDKATSIWELKAMVEGEQGSPLSLRGLEMELPKHGIKAGKTVLHVYDFALKNLSELGAATQQLSRNLVAELQPVLPQFERIVCAANKDWHTLRGNVLQSVAKSFETSDDVQLSSIVAAFDHAVALNLGESPDYIAKVRELAQQFPAESIEDLAGQVRNKQKQGRVSKATATPTDSSTDKADAVTANIGSLPVPDNSASALPQLQSEQKTINALVHAELTPHQLVISIQKLAQTLAKKTGVEDCLYLHGAFPTGFYVEAPQDMIDSRPDQPFRYVGWWVLAKLSLQLSGDHAARMPVESRWRQAQRMENGNDETALLQLIEFQLGTPVSLNDFAAWLLNPDSPGVTEYMELVSNLRRLQAMDKSRFAVSESESNFFQTHQEIAG